MDEPIYPSVQNQSVPDLGLAQYSVSTPQTQVYTTSDSTGPVTRAMPELDNFDHDPLVDIGCMGIDPDIPYFDLELANDHEIMTPAQLAAPAGIGQVNAPTWHEPDMSVPGLRTGDLTGPGIDHVGELEPDPHTGDLLQFARPGGLDIHAASAQNVAPDPMLPDLDEYDRPAGLEMPALTTPDPTLPDLQQPELEQDVHMSDRPGDLAAGALDTMNETKGEGDNELPTENYNELFMAQKGENDHRARHMGTLELGLEHERRRR